MPLVTIVIPTYRRPAFLREALKSVLAQTVQDWECIVVDSWFGDGAAEVAGAFHDDRIRYVSHHPPGEIAQPRNAGVAAGSGRLLAFLDDDDVWMPSRLERAVETMKREPSAEFVYAPGRIWYTLDDGSGSLRLWYRSWSEGRLAPGELPSGIIIDRLMEKHFISASGVLMTRALFERAGGFREAPEYFGVDDYELWLRCSCLSPFESDPRPVFRKRRHSGQTSHGVNMAPRISAARDRFRKWLRDPNRPALLGDVDAGSLCKVSG